MTTVKYELNRSGEMFEALEKESRLTNIPEVVLERIMINSNYTILEYTHLCKGLTQCSAVCKFIAWSGMYMGRLTNVCVTCAEHFTRR
jgi:hypothetical protein